MNAVNEYFKQAELSQAAYANLAIGILGDAELVALRNTAGMPSSQAQHFSVQWQVVDQFTGVTGASATVFQNITTNQKYLAIRGTELAGSDLTADGLLAPGVPASLNPQFIELKDQIDAWLTAGTLDSTFTVSGHSLGGYLAAAVKQHYGAQVTDAFLFNAPGVSGPLGNLADLLTSTLGLSGTPSGNIWNIRGSEGFPAISGLGYQLGTAVSIQIEAATGAGLDNHSIVRLADALAVQSLYAQLAPSLTQDKLNALVDASGTHMENTLESALDALRMILLDPGTTGTPTDNRNSLYTNLYDLTVNASYTALAGAPGTQLSVLPANAIATMSGINDAQGLSARYALVALNPFVLTGADYSAFNANGALNLFDHASGTGTITQQYLADRAALLERKLWFSTQDKAPVNPSITYDANNHLFENEPTYFEDVTTGYKVSQGGLFDNTHHYFFGGNGDDICLGAVVDDHLFGGSGNDTYLINTGDGNEAILDTDRSGSIRYNGATLTGGTKIGSHNWRDASGISYTLITTGTGQDLLIDAGAEHITVKDYSAGELGINLTGTVPIGVIFPDGHTSNGIIFYGDRMPYLLPWSPYLLSPAWPYAFDANGNMSRTTDAMPYWPDRFYDTVGDDYIYAGDGFNAIYVNKGGNNYAETGANDDYIKGGSGREIIFSGGMSDTIDVAGGDDIVYGQDGGDVIAGGMGNDFLVGGADADAIDGGAGNDKVYAGDPVTWMQATMDSGIAVAGLGELLAGGAGNDTVIGDQTDDALLGGEGQDMIAGHQGNDIILGDSGIDFIAPALSEFDDLIGMPYWPMGTNTGTPSLYATAPMLNIQFQKIDHGIGAANRFEVKLSSAVSPNWITPATAGDNDTLYGGSGNDWLFGEFGDDTLAGGAGNDTLLGGAGNDTYIFNVGDGNDIIVDNSSGGETNTLLFGAGFDPAQVTLFQGSLGLDLGNGDIIHIEGVDYDDIANTSGIQRFMFADGTVLTVPELVARGFDVDGGSGDDILQGTGVADRIDGGAGNDTLQGGAGNDVYLFDRGSGQDTIIERDATAGNLDTIRLAAGIAVADVTLSRDDSNLYLEIGGTGDKITVQGWFDDAAKRVEQIQFADGTVWDISVLQAAGYPYAEPANRIDGTKYNDTLAGSDAADLIDGAAGNDAISGGGGNDLIIGGAGSDVLAGGVGDDTFRIIGSDTAYDRFQGDDGNDLIQGSDGDDVIRMNIFTGESTVEKIDGGAGSNLVAGTQYNDTLNFSGTSLVNIANIDGGAGNDAITGSAGNDLIIGGAGSDVLAGGVGDDVFQINGSDTAYDRFQGDDGNDLIQGSDGDDVIRMNVFTGVSTVEKIDGRAGNNIVAGTQYNDTLDLSATELVNIANIDGDVGNDAITGSAGNDLIIGGAGSDILAGGAGDDIFQINGNDTAYDRFQGDTGYDFIQGGNGDDIIRMNIFSGASTVEKIDGGAGNNVISGTQYNDTLDLSGTYLVNIANIDAGAGNDAITGSAGNDLIVGGAGSDVLAGGLGNDIFQINGSDAAYDRFQGDDGYDLIQGGDDDDIIRMNVFSSVSTVEKIDGGAGNNVVAGTQYNDTLDFSTTELVNIANIDGGAGNDAITGSAGNDLIIGGAGSDVLAGGTGDDVFQITGSDTAYDRFQGDDGNDLIQGSDNDDIIRMNVFSGVSAVEKIDGGAGNNIVSGTQYNDTLNFSGTSLFNITNIDGGAGNDAITGGAGNDLIIGGAGSDVLAGGMGDDIFRVTGSDTAYDRFQGDDGNDLIQGSDGDDVIRMNVFTGVSTVEKIDGGMGNNVVAGTQYNDTLDLSATELVNIANIDGGAGNDAITGSAANDLIQGGDGSDVLNGSAGNDALQGGLGNDTLADTSGKNLFDGGAGLDTLRGGADSELFIGGAGNDTITTGTGADVIAFNLGDGQDTVIAGTGTDNTLSLGGGIGYGSLSFSKSSNNLILTTGANESITFQNWYTSPANHGVLTLQVITEAMAGYDTNSTDSMLNKKVQKFDFSTLVNAFDLARAANPTLTAWNLTDSLLDAHLAASDTSALGGDLAYRYGMNGTLAGISSGAALDVMEDAQFGVEAQTLRPWAGLVGVTAALG